jgi:OOP family OmpA-OmpF porin
MFEDSLLESGGQMKSKKGTTVLISTIVHIVLVAILILIPLISYSELPKQQLMTMLIAPPPPPPPPPPAPKVERTIILDDVLFDFDKSTVKPEAAAILDRLVGFMNENKNAKVSLSGYTDNVGTEAYNLKLSERRWMSSKDYLVKKGVDSGRVSGQGFGETKPIADNKTKEGRAKNRRVEIKVE